MVPVIPLDMVAYGEQPVARDAFDASGLSDGGQEVLLEHRKAGDGPQVRQHLRIECEALGFDEQDQLLNLGEALICLGRILGGGVSRCSATPTSIAARRQVDGGPVDLSRRYTSRAS